MVDKGGQARGQARGQRRDRRRTEEYGGVKHLSYWIDASGPGTGYPAQNGDVRADVAALGGGIVGLTAALLKREGKGERVTLAEMGQVGRGVTGHSTDRITSQHELVHTDLSQRFGDAGACLRRGESGGADTDCRLRRAGCHRPFFRAMRTHGVERFVYQSAWGVGESKNSRDHFGAVFLDALVPLLL